VRMNPIHPLFVAGMALMVLAAATAHEVHPAVLAAGLWIW
jgi:hypothetical protein